MQDYYVRQASDQRFSDLRMVFCGREECPPLHSWGPAVRPNYIMHYILSGKGTYQVGSDKWDLHEREGFLIEPEVSTFYQADAEDPWTYVWIGFDGRLAPELVSELGLGGNRLTFCCDRKAEMEEVFTTIFQRQRFSEVNELILESLLYRFFAILMQDCRVTERKTAPGSNNYVQGAVRFIRNNYYRPIKVEQVADYIGIDRSYLYLLFRKETGMSPSEYLVTFRLTRAAELLKLTALSVESVAFSCGYQDALVFSKAFRRKYGISPLKFRIREGGR